MWKTLQALALAGATLLLAACTTPTPYAPAAETGRYGYAQERIDAETWRVSFSGNSVTPRSQVEDLLLYRGAELAREQGAEGFVVLNQDTERKVSYRGVVYPYYGRGWGPSFAALGFGSPYRTRHVFGYGAGFGAPLAGDARLDEVERYTAYATIRLYSGEAPQGLGVPYDSGEIIATLGPRIPRPEAN